MKFTQIPADTFKNIQMNAGILLEGAEAFVPATGNVTASSILGATSGGINFTATPTYTDYGDDIDNCPKNTMELKKLDSWEAKLLGTYVAITPDLAKLLVGAGDVDGTKITPRNDVNTADFKDLWWVGDYSDMNGDQNGGFCAIHLMNGLSTGGFQIQSTDKGKGQFSFEFTGHYKMSEQNKVPFEIYVKLGTAEA